MELVNISIGHLCGGIVDMSHSVAEMRGRDKAKCIFIERFFHHIFVFKFLLLSLKSILSSNIVALLRVAAAKVHPVSPCWYRFLEPRAGFLRKRCQHRDPRGSSVTFFATHFSCHLLLPVGRHCVAVVSDNCRICMELTTRTRFSSATKENSLIHSHLQYEYERFHVEHNARKLV